MYICMEVRLYDHDTYSTYAYACTHCTYGEEVYTHTHTHVKLSTYLSMLFYGYEMNECRECLA